jgi:SNF2 domain-containing protein/helicase-like protein
VSLLSFELPSADLFRIAEHVRLSYDIELPRLGNWNYDACAHHDRISGPVPVLGCHHCGVRPRRHQRIGITWLWLTKRAGLFDSTGLGKTLQVAGLLALMQANGDLRRKVLIICRASTIGQWRSELARMVPSLAVAVVSGTARERGAALARPWEVALCGPEMLVSKVTKGAAQVEQFDIGTVICDDIEPLKNVNKTSRMIRKLCDEAERVVICTATPLDKRLTQLYDLGSVLGWDAVLGTREEFQHRHVRMEQVWFRPKLKPTVCRYCKTFMKPDFGKHAWVDKAGSRGPCPRKPGQNHFALSRMRPEPKFTWAERGPVAENLPEFREKIAPLVLRRTAADCDDMAMPDVEPAQVWLDLGTRQQDRYDEIRRGILTRQNEAGERLSRQEAENWWLRAWQVTSGLANLDSGVSGESVKLDWVTDVLTGDLSDEPVVVYCYFRKTLADLSERLGKAGVSNTRIWGEQDLAATTAALAAFNGGAARVMLITEAGGAGLNLQKARRLIMVDTPRSAARMTQIIGRIKRDGSEHATAYVTQLLSATPVERALAETISREALMSAAVLDDGQLAAEFSQASPEDLLKSVTG